MIICSCNVLSDEAVRSAMSSPNPPRTPCQVHRHFGCTAKCGRCTRSLRDAMDDGRAEQPMEQMPVAKVA
ncbi:BFD domain protein (2Fe-2S)-binding domain protein [Rhodomicrobium vannielii ATCC 17100]|uniref:Bacterioferritin-associated ferredoxin n=1 Tax=Rhodomicrobium vannielii (strain ATCC 17100 / DSM 162 / LMG 4299 / NCIMB 10020 / ATH 3.1.1) TaxID=648757 RepID=E3I8J2_RHOVT|nr:BFD domain protein (2Fe-2S)-binding domain protein [Rhodomicrobium vannielii ATCC 17100]